MNPDSSRKIGSFIRIYMIARDLLSGSLASLGFAAFGVAILLLDHSGKNRGFAIGLIVIAPFTFALTVYQLYRRLTQQKNQSANLAYQATDGNVAINRPSALRTDVAVSDLVSQTIGAWMGPVFSNQNIHIVWLGTDSTPNTENTLLVTEKFLIGLLIGPAADSSSPITQLLNMAPLANGEKNALGAAFDGQALRQNMEEQITTKQLPELVHEYAGFVVPLAEIKTISANDSTNTLNIQFKDGKNRSWVYMIKDDRLFTFCERVQASL